MEAYTCIRTRGKGGEKNRSKGLSWTRRMLPPFRVRKYGPQLFEQMEEGGEGDRVRGHRASRKARQEAVTTSLSQRESHTKPSCRGKRAAHPECDPCPWPISRALTKTQDRGLSSPPKGQKNIFEIIIIPGRRYIHGNKNLSWSYAAFPSFLSA